MLDATFDHIKPVALAKMPDWLCTNTAHIFGLL